jgi:hypothetical protein
MEAQGSQGCQDVFMESLLPTKENIFRRKVVRDPNCPICAREPKLVLHILWLCPSTQDVWGCCPMRLQKTCATGTYFNSIWEVMQERCREEELSLMAILARNIWLHRNTVIHEEVFKHPSAMLKDVPQGK